MIKDFFKSIYHSILKILPAKIVFNIENLRGYHRFININNPKYFGEKIHWIQINGNLERYTNYVDKYRVRDYVKKVIGEDYLIPLIDVYRKPEEIRYDELPNKFVLKGNHGSGYNLIVDDKGKIDILKINKKLKRWIKEDYSKIKKEIQYKNVDRRIVCEEYINDSKGELLDYKFFCFNHEPKFVKVDSDRRHKHTIDFFDLDWNKLDLKSGKYENSNNIIKRPDNFEEMIKIAKILCRDFYFVRVDLYNVDGKIYFGELTFTPGSGINAFKPLEKDIEIANMIDINEYNKKFEG